MEGTKRAREGAVQTEETEWEGRGRGKEGEIKEGDRGVARNVFWGYESFLGV